MSKIINMTPEIIKECTEELSTMLKSSSRIPDGKFTYSKIFPTIDRKATVFITPTAYTKMLTLLAGFSTEVAWHGVAERFGDLDADTYVITDILVYPQTVSSATVDMDETEYANWIMKNADDERFENIRMQGHSHVNMGVSPSATDISHQETILEMLGDDDFYIFMIYNKSLSKNVRIYDLQKNIMFDNADVSVEVLIGDVTQTKFLSDAKEMVKSKTYSTGNKQYGTWKSNGDSESLVPTNSDKKTPSGNKTKDRKSSFDYGSYWASGAYDDDDDDDDPNGPFGCRDGYGRGCGSWR